MNIPVLLEPISTGFRASTGAPLNLAAEAPTEEAALTALHGMFLAKRNAGAKIVEMIVPSMNRLGALTPLLAADHEILDEVDAIIKENRRLEAAEDIGAEAAAEIAKALAEPQMQQEPAA